VPKISAATVVEHRAAQRAALLRATEELLPEAGVAGVTPRAVAERAGLARSTFYEYFPSRDDVLAAVAIAAFDRWAAEIDAALADVDDADRLRVYVEQTMRMTADGRHGIASTLRETDLAPSDREAVMALHTRLLDPLRALLRGSGAPDLDVQVALVQGVLTAGVRLAGHGVDPSVVSAHVMALLENGLPTRAV
jgi:AcrR family transcriptional regulator